MSNLALTPPQNDLDVAPLLLPATVLWCKTSRITLLPRPIIAPSPMSRPFMMLVPLPM